MTTKLVSPSLISLKMQRQIGVGVALLSKILLPSTSTSLVKPKFLQRNLSSPRIQNGSSLLSTNNALFHKFPLTIPNTTSLRSFHSLDRRRRSIFRRFTTNEIVVGLIATNVAVYLLWKVGDRDFMVEHFVLTVHHIKDQRLHTLVTSAFSHTSQIDLITTILGLFFFGRNIGRSFGPEYLVNLYLGGAVAGSIFYVVYRAFLAPPLKGKMKGIDNSIVPAMGAGGAVNAIMLLNVFLFPSKTILLMGALMGGFEISRLHKGDRRVSGSTYLGGATAAAFAWLIDRKRRFRRF